MLAALLFPLPAPLPSPPGRPTAAATAAAPLDGVQLPDQLQRRVGPLVPAFGRRHELAPGVRPAADVLDLARAVQPFVLGQRVGLQIALVAFEERSGPAAV